MSFSDLGLLPELLRAVADKGYDTPSPIQLQAIPAVLSGRDVLAGAQTGTGKTASFVLPILQRLNADTAHPRASSPHRSPTAHAPTASTCSCAPFRCSAA
jgi:ATP-dependent RNA helicase RhlE